MPSLGISATHSWGLQLLGVMQTQSQHLHKKYKAEDDTFEYKNKGYQSKTKNRKETKLINNARNSLGI